MKRKKQVGAENEVEVNGHNAAPTPKKNRTKATSSPADEREHNGSHASSTRRKSSQIQRVVEEPLVPETESQDLEKDILEEESAVTTPIKSGRGRDVAGGVADGSVEMGSVKIGTPTNRLRKMLFATPVKNNGIVDADTPRISRNADRPARQKSTRAIIEKITSGDISDNDDEEENLVQRIFDSDGDGDGDGDGGLGQDGEPSAESNILHTPSRRGRKKGPVKRRRSPTPPPDFTSHEKYFFQNRGGRAKTSNNTLSTLALLDHEEYFSRTRKIKDRHAEDIKFLEQLHAESFNQWQFELSQNFSLCVYGWGSKRSLLMKFADHVYKWQMDHSVAKLVIVNGYVHNLTIRDVLNTVGAAFSGRGQTFGRQPADMLEKVISLLEEDKAQDVTLIIHGIDRIPLRRPATQTILSRLSSHPQVHLVASADHPSFPLLWDSSLMSTFNFLFHDCTTFQPYIVEVDVVDEVHELLGRSGRRVGGKEGVSFVLKSLPENAKSLFRVLIGEQLAAMDESPGPAIENDEDAYSNEQAGGLYRKSEPGVEYRVLYQKAVEEFICSNDMNFRTLLKEFHDHQMIQSRKDALGTEMLSVPFRKEELETILEDITAGE